MNPFGTVNPPSYLATKSVEGGFFGQLINLFTNLLIVAGGIYALVNIILAGYTFMSAGGDPKKVEQAWSKIYQTLIGLAFVAGAFVLTAIFSKLLFGDFGTLLTPKLPTL